MDGAVLGPGSGYDRVYVLKHETILDEKHCKGDKAKLTLDLGGAAFGLQANLTTLS